MNRFETFIEELPLIAILRGLRTEMAIPVATALVDAGFRVIEVPLNSPNPFDTIGALATRFADRALIGAGTVLEPEQVRHVQEQGGELIVMPHSDPAVIAETKSMGITCVPGVATPTEAFAALRAGATGLKMFPAEGLPPAVLKAWRAVLASNVPLFPVGGIAPETMAPYLDAGATGFGLGSALFKPDMPVDEVATNAQAFVRAFAAWRENRQP